MRKLIWIACIPLWSVAACTFTQKVQTGLQAYEVKQYSIATQLFEKEFNESRTPAEKAKLAFLAGESYSFLNHHVPAGEWYLKANKEGYGDEALERYANALKHQERYEEALKVYEDLLKANQGNAGYRSNVTLCRQAMDWIKNPNTAYKIASAGFNSPGNDFSPQPIGKNMVLFTSDRDSKQSSETYLWTGRAYSDIYVAGTKSPSPQVEPYDNGINTEENEGTAVLSPDGNVLVFTRCFSDGTYDAWCKLMISFRRGTSWSTAEPFPFVKEKMNYGHPAFAANGTTLFFSSDMPGGLGGHDIYYTQPDGKGGWNDPVNLGPMINTLGHEQYPTVYKDTLYFSSDRLAGLGGLDIFKTYLNSENNWVSPINLRAPINSGNDDFGFVVDTFEHPVEGVLMSGYFTSSRASADRNDEIYSFTLFGEIPDTNAVPVTSVVKEEEKDELINYKLYLSLRVMEPEYENPEDPNSRKIGNRPLPNGPVILSEGLTDQRFVTDELGHLLLNLDWDKTYVFTARYRDHLADKFALNPAEIVKDPLKPVSTVNHIMILDPIFRNKEIVLENIFYDYDQWAIRDDAKPSLNRLSNIMKSNPAIRIQLSSHTDCRGTDEYNQDLSQKRAQAAIEYLMSVGIPGVRLEAHGYGESSPAVICDCEKCTEEQHQTNRRTTFKIID